MARIAQKQLALTWEQIDDAPDLARVRKLERARKGRRDDWRRFGPIPHGTKKRKRLYNGRTAVQRVNARIKHGLTLEELIVRSKKKVAMKLDLAVLVLYPLAQFFDRPRASPPISRKASRGGKIACAFRGAGVV